MDALTGVTEKVAQDRERWRQMLLQKSKKIFMMEEIHISQLSTQVLEEKLLNEVDSMSHAVWFQSVKQMLYCVILNPS